MSDDFEPEATIETSNLAALVLSQEIDSLTDVLVKALYEVYRILDDSHPQPGTVH
ncbi:hypothetical protein GOZ78_20290 [Agrobacterium vitis]|uniref:Uncharacterized protein n=1 Tax=Agrobacterium vitis TaxID=373 RepID=A0AAE5APP3_AGRVI|nr:MULTISPECIES: hypothetical protein [Rhizobium/Agrobacterium group]MCM2440395.1 hypothetical protein [Agrobacterium vitis]MUO28796.1 hypothetical protein [Agrobacterium vitis]MUO42752.1 hypothetical protein [Agrobacterium vitis]MUO81453.1 hypothetical protein [Agrobacterium vitis]MUO96057.1 hypothetical protein [Agrobacterium vitis]